MIKIKVKQECPPATQDPKLNLKNRQHAIEEYGYGPPNPSEPSEEFWAKKADMWNVSADEVKNMRCGNCAAFNQKSQMLSCIEKGLGQQSTADDYESTINKAELGYCQMYKFKCAASRTCDSWLTGGPIK